MGALNGNAAYWGAIGDPRYATGVNPDENLDDLRIWQQATGFDLVGRVLDIGCGTGRLARACEDYVGVDITPSFVDYCVAKGLDARLISGADDLPDERFDTITMLSVLTHIATDERHAYLDAIAARLDGECLIDILPGDQDQGNVQAWYVPPAVFEAELAERGFRIISVFDWTAGGRVLHRYYRIARG